MATSQRESTRPRRRKVLYESRREREFYRYYEPIRALTVSGPLVCSLYDEHFLRDHRPFSSPDPALTAFCQLAALRLQTRRAMLFFFDSNYSYVLAEATKTLSLKDDTVIDNGDELWLGHSVIPRGLTVCEETVCKLPLGDGGPFSPENSQKPIHIINDMEKDTQFCNRLYVTDGPKARFYAGVPITTPRGITIGAFCCLDDKKRDGLDAREITFLQDMASTVMKHLEMVRARVEQERGARMVSGLGAFIEGASNLREWDDEDEDSIQVEEPQSRRDSVTKPRPYLAAGTGVESAVPTSMLPRRSTGSISLSSVKNSGGSDLVATPPDMPSTRNLHTRASVASRHAEDLRERIVSSNVRSTYERAARLLREATDVDGAVFLDATVGSYGGLVNDTNRSGPNSHDATTSESGTEVTETETERTQGKENGQQSGEKRCGILASSHLPPQPQNHPSGPNDSPRKLQGFNVTEKFLHSLLRRYPHGKIWNFNEKGVASSDDDSSEGYASRRSGASEPESPRDTASDAVARRRRKRVRADDGREIQRFFPGVRSLALVGQWDYNRGRWYSACAIWTRSPLRLFSTESEVNYVSAFCDVIMAEVYRLEAQDSDKAKSDFISSISHELRTPLHGILGSVECLHEQELDTFTADLASQIEICGRTLLDIVNHLLEFAKINHHTSVRASMSDGMMHRRGVVETREARLSGMMTYDADVALNEVTEEVVESAVYSFCCSRDKQMILNRKVAVVLDIEKGVDVDWKCRLPVGGWKRICINLVSNALKYTKEGYIQVSLRRTPIPGKRRRTKLVLTVTDTGCGMSEKFLKNHLFRAFSQEDSLVEGTGLGMSLVATIVKALGGKIEVQSEQGSGTTVTVTVPLTEQGRQSRDDASGVSDPGAFGMPNSPVINIIAYECLKPGSSEQSSALMQIARGMVLRNLKQSCNELGLKTFQTEHTLEPTADVFFILEPDLYFYLNTEDKVSDPRVTGKPLIVICESVQSARLLRSTISKQTRHSHIEFIAQPCGPERLIKALRNCATATGSKLNEAIHRQALDTIAGANGEPMPPPNGTRARPPQDTSPKDLPFRGSIRRSDTEDGALSPRSISPHPPPALQNHDSHLSPSDEVQVGDTKPAYFTRSRSTGNDPLSPLIQPVLSPGAAGQQATETRNAELSLLLVDDNQINLQLLINYATKQGFSRLTARDGQQAVNAYKAACADGRTLDGGATHLGSGRPDVVLMDINMPVMDGLEATRIIRAFEQQEGLSPSYIIALTGLGSAQAQQEAFSSGVDLFLTKPVRLKELTKLLSGIRESSTGRL